MHPDIQRRELEWKAEEERLQRMAPAEREQYLAKRREELEERHRRYREEGLERQRAADLQALTAYEADFDKEPGQQERERLTKAEPARLAAVDARLRAKRAREAAALAALRETNAREVQALADQLQVAFSAALPKIGEAITDARARRRLAQGSFDGMMKAIQAVLREVARTVADETPFRQDLFTLVNYLPYSPSRPTPETVATAFEKLLTHLRKVGKRHAASSSDYLLVGEVNGGSLGRLLVEEAWQAYDLPSRESIWERVKRPRPTAEEQGRDAPSTERGARPLPETTREAMEASFGQDFSGVKIHADSARVGGSTYAVTEGNEIHFAPGRFQPETTEGKQLLGHELAHVVQQRGGGEAVQAFDPSGERGLLEAEADRAGEAAAAGRTARVALAARGGGPQYKESGAAPPTITIPDAQWRRFCYAIGVKKSGNRAPDADGVIGTGLKNAAAVDGSYGRFQTTASNAIEVLKEHESVRAKSNLSLEEVRGLEKKLAAVKLYWNAVVKDDAAAKRALDIDEEALAEARRSDKTAKAFIAQQSAHWTETTGLKDTDLDRLVACHSLRAALRGYRGDHAKDLSKLTSSEGTREKKEHRKEERLRVAQEFFGAHKEECKRARLDVGALTAYLTKGTKDPKTGTIGKEGIMAENLAGFQMLAAGGKDGPLSRAINKSGGIEFGMVELEGLKRRVARQALRAGVTLPTNVEHLLMLCARAHNGGLTVEHLRNPATLADDQYVSAVMKIYRSYAGEEP